MSAIIIIPLHGLYTHYTNPLFRYNLCFATLKFTFAMAFLVHNDLPTNAPESMHSSKPDASVGKFLTFNLFCSSMTLLA